MACKPTSMAHRKRPGASGGTSLATPGPVPCPSTRPTEPRDLKSLPARQRPVRYPKEPRNLKHHPPPRSCKPQYSSTDSQDEGHNHPDVHVDTDVEVNRYNHQSAEAEAELEDRRPPTPPTPEHVHEQVDFHGAADSLDDDSSSDYINNTSDDEDYDDGEPSVLKVGSLLLLYCGQDRKIEPIQKVLFEYINIGNANATIEKPSKP